MSNIIPIVYQQSRYGERNSDIFSYHLNKNRIVFLTDTIDVITAENIIAQLLYLDDTGDNDIWLYINSHGGSVVDGLSIYDCMNNLHCRVNTMVTGQAASMGAVILSSGYKRYAYYNATIMAHQVSSIAVGKEIDMEISMAQTKSLNERLMNILAKNCNKSFDEIMRITDRDYFMTAKEALSFQLIDKII